MQFRMPLAALCATAVAAGSVVLATEPALAAVPEPTVKVERYNRGALRAPAAASAKVRQRMAASTADYLNWSARRGRPLDLRNVDTLSDPTGSVIVSSMSTSFIDGLDVGTYVTTGGETAALGVGVRSHETADSASAASASPVIGFAGNPSFSGFVLDASGGITISSNHDRDIVLTGQLQYLRSEYWKYTLPEAKESAGFSSTYRSGSDFWAYARRGIGEGRGTFKDMTDLTVRSRPWGGTSGSFKNIINYAPTGSQTSCRDGGSISFNYGGAGISIPTNNCGSVKGLTSRTALEMGADWDGDTGEQRAVEALATYRVNEGYRPSFADYIWATFEDDLLICCSQDVKWTDTGW